MNDYSSFHENDINSKINLKNGINNALFCCIFQLLVLTLISEYFYQLYSLPSHNEKSARLY